MEYDTRSELSRPAAPPGPSARSRNAGPTHPGILALQRQAGNRAVTTLLKDRTLQRKDGDPTATPTGTAAPIGTDWHVEYSEVPQGGKSAPRPRTEDRSSGRRDRLIVDELQVGPGAGHSLKGGNYAASGRSHLGHYEQPGANGQVAGRVSYHQAKDIKIGVEVPVIAHLEGRPAPTPGEQAQLERAVRDAAIASVNRQWAAHEGEDAAIEAQAAQDAKAALPPGISGMVRVTLSVGGPTAREYPLPSVDYQLPGPANCYVDVDVPTREFAFHAKNETSSGQGSAARESHGGSQSTETDVRVGGTASSGSASRTQTDVKLAASQERRVKILQEYEKTVSTSFTRDFKKVWQDIADIWRSGSGMSTETSTPGKVTVDTGPGAEDQLKKQSDDEKDPSLWERAKRAVKGFVTGKLKGWISDKAAKILGKTWVFRYLPGGVGKWVARELTDLGWKVGEWLWDKITGSAKADHTPERDVTPRDQGPPSIQQQEIVRTRLQNYAFTINEFREQAGTITEHFRSDVTEAVHRSLETEFDYRSSVDVHKTVDTGQGSSTTVGGSAGAKTRTSSGDSSTTANQQASSETRVYETDGVRVEGGSPAIRLTVKPV